MDEYEAALSLFLYHYYNDMAAAAYAIAPPVYLPLTKAAAVLCWSLVPDGITLPSMVHDVYQSVG